MAAETAAAGAVASGVAATDSDVQAAMVEAATVGEEAAETAEAMAEAAEKAAAAGGGGEEAATATAAGEEVAAARAPPPPPPPPPHPPPPHQRPLPGSRDRAMQRQRALSWTASWDRPRVLLPVGRRLLLARGRKRLRRSGEDRSNVLPIRSESTFHSQFGMRRYGYMISRIETALCEVAFVTKVFHVIA